MRSYEIAVDSGSNRCYGDEGDLFAECDNTVRNGPVIEFWGRDDEGNKWRVHLDRSARRAP